MKHPKNTSFTDRLSAQAEAKKALVAKLRPKPTVTAEDPDARKAAREAELAAVRAERDAARQAKRMATEEAERRQREADVQAKEAQDAAQREKQKAALLAMYGRKRR